MSECKKRHLLAVNVTLFLVKYVIKKQAEKLTHQKERTNAMKRDVKKGDSYATNKGGFIKATKNPAANDPKATRTSGNDLRTKNGKK